MAARGTDLEAGILTTALLVDFDIPHIWAKAVSRQHGRILQRMGAHHVVLPEHEVGERVAHLVTGRMLDFIEFEDDYAMVKTLIERTSQGCTVQASGTLPTRTRSVGVSVRARPLRGERAPAGGSEAGLPATRKRR